MTVAELAKALAACPDYWRVTLESGPVTIVELVQDTAPGTHGDPSVWVKLT